MSLNSSLEQLAELAEKRDEVHFAFIKQILLMASGLLGILVSLHKSTSTDDNSRISFALALGLLSPGILLLTIGLSAQVAVRRDQFVKWKAEVLLPMQDENYRPKNMISGNPSKIYAACEKTGYVSLTLSVICLTIYAVLIA